MNPFLAGFIDGLRKQAEYPLVMPWNMPKQDVDKDKPTPKESLETAARDVLANDYGYTFMAGNQNQPTGYGVTVTKPGTMPVSAPYMSYQNDSTTSLKRLKEKWNAPGVKPTTVGAGTRESPRR